MKNQLNRVCLSLLVIAVALFTLSCTMTGETAKKDQVILDVVEKKSDADGAVKNGVFIRKNSPAFSLKLPNNFSVDKDYAEYFLYYGSAPAKAPNMGIRVYEMPDAGFEAAAKTLAKEFKASRFDLGSPEAEITKFESIDTYGDHRAYEIECTWTWTDESTTLVSVNHVIEKEGRIIYLEGTYVTPRDDPDFLRNLYGDIDLAP